MPKTHPSGTIATRAVGRAERGVNPFGQRRSRRLSLKAHDSSRRLVRGAVPLFPRNMRRESIATSVGATARFGSCSLLATDAT